MDQDALDDLLENLRKLVNLLERSGEVRWAAWFYQDLARLKAGDAYGIDHLRQAYGGTGSINDLLLSPYNGHSIPPGEAPTLNDELHRLLTAVYEATSAR